MTDRNNGTSSSSYELPLLYANDVHINVKQTVIVVTQDKLKLSIQERQDALLARHAWMAPLSLVLPLIATLVTADFRDFGLGADVWNAIFIVALALSCLWLLHALLRRPKRQSVDEFIEILKSGEN